MADALQSLSNRLAAETWRRATVRLALGHGQARARLQVQVGLLYERAAAQIATARWPDPVSHFARTYAVMFGDPKEFIEKIGKLVFGSPSIYFKAHEQWNLLAKRYYRAALRMAKRGAAAAPWIRLARRRLARLQGKRSLQPVRVANGMGSGFPAGIELLLVPVSHPPPLSKARLRAIARSQPRHRMHNRSSTVLPKHLRPRGLPVSYNSNKAAQARRLRYAIQRLLRRGLAAEKAKQYARARRVLSKATALGPRLSLLLVALGRVQLKLADISGALRTVGRLELAGHNKAAEHLRKKLRKVAR